VLKMQVNEVLWRVTTAKFYRKHIFDIIATQLTESHCEEIEAFTMSLQRRDRDILPACRECSQRCRKF
jgi:hypothetical protein